MNFFTFLSTIFLIFQTHAQLSFFVKPTVNFKSCVSSTQPFLYSGYSINPSPYYHYSNMNLTKNIFNSLDLGFTIGAKTKKGNLIFELGLSGDQTQSGFTFHEMMKNGYVNYYYDDMILYRHGRAFPRTYFRTSLKLKEFNNKSTIYLIGGFDYAYKKNHATGPLLILESNAQVDEKTYLYRYSATSVMSLQNFFVHFGLSSEIHVKDNYLFDVSIFYNHGFRQMTQVNTRINIYDDVSSKQYLYSSYSKGSGIYLQLARKFQIYPRKQKKGAI